MEYWERSLATSITSLKELADRYHIDIEPLEPVVERYPMRINPCYLSLIEGDPVWRWCISDLKEPQDGSLPSDAFNKEGLLRVSWLVHRYPDRVILPASSTCATLSGSRQADTNFSASGT